MTYAQRIDREDESDRLRRVLREEHYAARERIAQGFRHVTLGLMSWEGPPEFDRPTVYRCWDPQGEVEPFDVDADDRECWSGER